jgi:hypothetical protein
LESCKGQRVRLGVTGYGSHRKKFIQKLINRHGTNKQRCHFYFNVMYDLIIKASKSQRRGDLLLMEVLYGGLIDSSCVGRHPLVVLSLTMLEVFIMTKR